MRLHVHCGCCYRQHQQRHYYKVAALAVAVTAAAVTAAAVTTQLWRLQLWHFAVECYGFLELSQHDVLISLHTHTAA